MNAFKTIVGLGEVLWDVFPDGPRFGGAPANFSCSAASLADPTMRVQLVSAVGDDLLGQQAISKLKQKQVDASSVAVVEWPTGQVHVQLDEAGKASYEFAADAAWDNLPWKPALAELASRAAAACFGTLGQRSDQSRETIKHFLAAMPNESLRIFDINLRPPFYSDSIIRESLRFANVLKLNDEELPIVSGIYGYSGTDTEVLQQLIADCGLKAIALTRGSQGSLLIRGNEIHAAAAVATEVVDTVGAGDAFTATLAIGLLNEEPLAAINARAVRVAAFVCSQAGATPAIPEHVRS